MVTMGRQEFEHLVAEALDQVPAQFMQALDNVVFLVEDEPPAELEGALGVYEGIPATERAAWGEPYLPATITLFMNPIVQACDTVAEVCEEVLVTVVHELGHYFGIDDDRLDELGWG